MADRKRRLETIRHGGVEITTLFEGAGPALVMLPSYGRDGLADFDRTAELFAAEGWRVVRPQPRGVAGSSATVDGVTLAVLAADVAGVVRQVGCGPAVVLGHAFGNFVARAMAVRHPDLVRGVVLAAASASPERVRAEVEETPFVAGDPTRPVAERLAALRLAFFAPGHNPRPWLEGWYPQTLAMQRRTAQDLDVETFRSAGSAPVLEIIPRMDPFKPEASWWELRDALGARATTVVVDDAAHALFPEQPDRVADAVLRWVRERGV